MDIWDPGTVRIQRLASHIALLLLLCGCTAGGGVPPDGTAALQGDWGGVHAGLALTAQGGTITHDCAHGTLDAPVRPGPDGRFEVGGTHVREHGGPERLGDVPDARPARYVGRVTGDRMELRVLVGPDTLGPYALERGREPQLFRCL